MILKCHINHSNILLLGLASLLASTVQAAYISDELRVPLRSGPSAEYRIIHKGLPSGTQLDILNTDQASGFSEVMTSDNRQGWLRTQYLVEQPIAKIRLLSTADDLKKANKALREANTEIDTLSQRSLQQEERLIENKAKIDALEIELAEIKRISANTLDINKNNLTLTEINARLREELDDLSESHARLSDNRENQMFMIGGALLLLGLITGALIKARPQRSAWS